MARKLFRREGETRFRVSSAPALPLATSADVPYYSPLPEATLIAPEGAIQSTPRQRRSLPISPLYRRLVTGDAVRIVRPTQRPLHAKRISRLYADPRTVVCVRRRQRKEVLFALNRSGRNGTGKPYRRSYSSQWRC